MQIGRNVVLSWCRQLGLDPKSVKYIAVGPHQIVATVYELDEHGKHVQDTVDNRAMTYEVRYEVVESVHA